MKKCSWCGLEYGDAETVCTIDGKPLIDVTPKAEENVIFYDPAKPIPPGTLFLPRQIGRLSFVVRYIIFLISLVFAYAWITFGNLMLPGILGTAIIAVFSIVLLLLLLYFIRYIIIARLRDMGAPALLGFLIIIPFVNLLFLVALVSYKTDAFKLSNTKS